MEYKDYRHGELTFVRFNPDAVLVVESITEERRHGQVNKTTVVTMDIDGNRFTFPGYVLGVVENGAEKWKK